MGGEHISTHGPAKSCLRKSYSITALPQLTRLTLAKIAVYHLDSIL